MRLSPCDLSFLKLLPLRATSRHIAFPAVLRVVLLLAFAYAVQGEAQGTAAQLDPLTPKTVSTPTLADARELLLAGSHEKAIDAYRALGVDKKLAVEAGLGLARCRLQTGLYDEALSDLTNLAAEESAEWHYLLAQLHRRKGNYDKVLAHTAIGIRRGKQHAGLRLLRAGTLEYLGRRDDAIEAYAWFDKQLVGLRELPADPAWITSTAQGFLRYSILTRTKVASRTKHVLNEMLQVAYERLDRSYWPARIAAADLLREKYNNDDEDGSLSDYRAALRINERAPEAYVGMAEVALSHWKFEEIERLAAEALEINPSFAPAMHVLGKKSILERRYDEAIAQCDRALVINPKDLNALSLRAAAGACQYDDALVRAASERVAAINPRCALLHRTLGDALSGMRQYAASEREYLQAVKYDPTDANARTELGMMYMQWGDERKARDVLEAAWALDSFNERTKFTLELLEMLEKFDRIETEHFIVKYEAKSDPGLGQFIADYMETIYDDVTGDYATTVGGKTTIEIFPTHRAFGVRITGKPWIHTVGAATGRVIALASPRDKTILGAYNIARVLKHEFTHTVTLEATDNRIPHWLTEGLAVYQEDAPRSFPWHELLADAARRGRLFTLETIDWGFIRPRRANDRQMAYAQSEWMVEYIVERFGYGIINRMLARFRTGQPTRKVFSDMLGVEPAQFDGDFQVWATKQAARWGYDVSPPENVEELRLLVRENKDDAAILGRLARAEFDNGELEEAAGIAQQTLELDQNEPHALTVLATIWAMSSQEAIDEQAKRSYDDRASPLLERLLKADPDGWIAPKYLADIALRSKDFDRAEKLLKRLQRLCPFDPVSWRGLAGMYLSRGDDRAAFSQLLELARTQEDDAEIPTALGDMHKSQGRLREAQFWYRSALHIDPGNVELHQALGATSMQVGDSQSARKAYVILSQLEPDNAAHFENAAFAANKIGDKTAARKYAQQALLLNPESAARSLIP